MASSLAMVVGQVILNAGVASRGFARFRGKLFQRVVLIQHEVILLDSIFHPGREVFTPFRRGALPF